VRHDDDGIRRYVHLATGNYNPSTARFYTDISYLTCRREIGEDVTNLFNLLTGLCQFQETKQLVVAPFQMHDRIIGWIERETRHARSGLSGRIVAKMNSLVDETVIDTLYRASRAGVSVDLIVRGICCLKPGVPGMSENIRVRSIVDRFLEHSRIWYFENGHQPEVYVASADWMPRNFFKRIEVAFPILDGVLRERLVSEILAGSLADTVKARVLQPDGLYKPVKKGREGGNVRSQARFIDLATGVHASSVTRGRNGDSGMKGGRAAGRTTGSASRLPRIEIAPRPPNIDK